MSYSKGDVKDNIDEDDIYNLLDYLDAEPQMYIDHIEAKTICHNGGSHKLFYYFNSNLFQCWTECGSFDVIELVQKVKGIQDFNAAIYFLVNFFNLQSILNETEELEYSSEDWKIFDRNGELKEIADKDMTFAHIELESYDESVIMNYPRPIILPWVKEHISHKVCDSLNICYDPVYGNILIPHYDENWNCVGIRQRTLVKENEQFGKYRPWKHGKELYNHPLAFNLYGINWAKDNISKAQVAIVFESEKAVAQFLTFFGIDSSLAVAVCGSSLSKYQFELLQIYGAEEVVIAFDKDYETTNSEEYKLFEKKMKKINDKFASRCTLSFIVDTKGLLGYKCSPTDRGSEIFLELFRERKYIK